MSQTSPEAHPVPHGRTRMGTEPLVYHCHQYNFWLQYALLQFGGQRTKDLLIEVAQSTSEELLRSAYDESGNGVSKAAFAQEVFSQLGFGMMDLSEVSPQGGPVHFPVSHYGMGVSELGRVKKPSEPTTYFDAGFSAAAAAFVEDLPRGTFQATIERCQSLGDDVGRVRLTTRSPQVAIPAPGIGPHGEGAPSPFHSGTAISESDILGAVSGIDLTGNEEGLIPRFNVLLTRHLANFYNRCTFETLLRADEEGLTDALSVLLVNAGNRCAFHTFGGIMSSPEWDAVVRPSCKTDEDWVHGMVAVINCLGWGLWRVQELTEMRATFRIYDDYESTGWLAAYGTKRPDLSFLARGAAEGLMNLAYVGKVQERPRLDEDYYNRVFESDRSYQARQTSSRSAGDSWTEIIVEPLTAP